MEIFLLQSEVCIIKSCVKNKEGFSNFFPCECGVRQGENFSFILFSLYLNYLFKNTWKGIKLVYNTDILLHIIVLLYADDTILISDNPRDLQSISDKFKEYCDTWKLTVNLNKTKVVVFGSRGNVNLNFLYGENPIEIVTQYKYLGVILK